MKVLMLSSDRGFLSERSAVAARHREYAGLFDELHIVLVGRTARGTGQKTQIAKNGWAYDARARSSAGALLFAIRLGARIIAADAASSWVVTCQDPFEIGWIGRRIAERTGAALHLQVHTDFLSPRFARQSFRNRFRVMLARRVLPSASRVRVVSERIKGSLTRASRLFMHGSRIDVLPVFVDAALFRGAPVRFDLHARYPSWDFIILVVARLAPEKDIPLALSVLASVRREYPKTGMIIVGDGPLRPRLGQTAERMGVSDAVVFLGWQSDVASFYKSADLFLQTSRYEGYGLSLVEAVVAGCPAVSTDVGVAPLLLGGMGGFVCPVSDASCVAEKVRFLISHAKERSSLVSEARVALPRVTVSGRQEYLARYRNTLEGAISEARPVRSMFRVPIVVRYVVSGGIAAGVDLSLLYLLTTVFGLWYLLSATLAFVAALFISFMLQKFYTFKHADTSRKAVSRQLFLYSALALFNVGANTLLMYFFVEKLLLWYLAAQVFSGILIALWSFACYRFFVFRRS